MQLHKREIDPLFDAFPVLETDRFSLRQLTVADAPALFVVLLDHKSAAVEEKVEEGAPPLRSLPTSTRRMGTATTWNRPLARRQSEHGLCAPLHRCRQWLVSSKGTSACQLVQRRVLCNSLKAAASAATSTTGCGVRRATRRGR